MSDAANQAKAIFLESIEKYAPEQWPAFLDEACGGDLALRKRVEQLLRARAELGSFHDDKSGDSRTTLDQATAEQSGVVIADRYKLLEPIGEGGMGTVWMAQQTEPIRRTVALKLIKTGMDSKQVIARFEAERQALALMDHPSIARVIDGGTTESGRPFFVMELVKGVPITKYCDEHHLTPRQRLELFVPVCQAIQHAHQKGIIHRDIKPSNVLVAMYDDRPVPKVIDFGVAKATGVELTGESLHTGFGAVVGTLEYMSPEQASFNQLDVDTRSDIYSLGVLLYELFTGCPPFTRAEADKGGMLEMLRVIREQEPTKPSAKLSTVESLPTLAANRGTEPAKLTKLIRGELDWIVMKALEKDRNRRYETANGFAIDVQHYLNDEVVEARPPSAGYRIGKFLRRNKGRVAATGTLALSLLVGGGAVLAVKLQADHDRAAEAADRAAREAGTSASVSGSLNEARRQIELAWNDSNYPDRMQRATDAAVAAVQRAENFAAGGTPTDATQAELAAIRPELDDLVRHSRLISAADRFRRQHTDESSRQDHHPAITNFRNRLCEALRQFGIDPLNHPAAEVASTVVNSRIRDSLLGMLCQWHHAEPTQASRKPGSKEQLGQVVRSTRKACGGAYAQWQDLLDRNDTPGLVKFSTPETAKNLHSTLAAELARDLSRTGQYEHCRTFLRAAVDHYPDDVWLRYSLAEVCQKVRPSADAEALHHMSAACAQRPEIARFHEAVGVLYVNLGSRDQAIASFRKAAVLYAGSYDSIYSLGQTLFKIQDWDGAIAAYQECLRLRPGALMASRTLHGVLTHVGRHAEALRIALVNCPKPVGPDELELPGFFNLRSEAAFSAIKCADGQGVDAPPINERPAFRKQALDLLTIELGVYAKISKRIPEAKVDIHRGMQAWLTNKNLATVREPEALNSLTGEERAAWQKFWSEVRDLSDAMAPPPNAPKSEKK